MSGSISARVMDVCSLCLFLAFSIEGMSVVGAVETRCPGDYRKRVETCIMEAQLAPQAGGGITLVVKNDTIVDLCDRGLLRKTIDCLEEIRSRCLTNTSVVTELDRLYSVPHWTQGEQLLCQDTQLFQRNFECMSRLASSVTSCILMRTHLFRMGLTFTDPSDHAGVRDVTCSFAESIVKCVCSPLQDECETDMVSRVAGTMRLFLPPVCLAGFDNNSKYHTTTATTTTTQQPPWPMPDSSDDTER